MGSESGAGDHLRAGLERKLTDLRGRCLTAVDYWDVHNHGPEAAHWDYGDWHHAVRGVQLSTDPGPATITWTDTFYPYDIEVFHNPIAEHLVLAETARSGSVRMPTARAFGPSHPGSSPSLTTVVGSGGHPLQGQDGARTGDGGRRCQSQ